MKTNKQLGDEARARGEMFFTDGTPCRWHGAVKRYASTQSCYYCHNEAQNKMKARRPIFGEFAATDPADAGAVVGAIPMTAEHRLRAIMLLDRPFHRAFFRDDDDGTLMPPEVPAPEVKVAHGALVSAGKRHQGAGAAARKAARGRRKVRLEGPAAPARESLVR